MSTSWVKTIRRETGLIEHVCEHGIGHPAWASTDWMAHRFMEEGVSHEDCAASWGIHGCDGCCSDPVWQIESLKDSVKIMHRLFARQIKKLSDVRNVLERYGFSHGTSEAHDFLCQIETVLDNVD
jgi:hypothetical protein